MTTTPERRAQTPDAVAFAATTQLREAADKLDAAIYERCISEKQVEVLLRDVAEFTQRIEREVER